MLRILLLVVVILLVSSSASCQSQFDGYDVSQVHINQGSDPTEMIVSWITSSFSSLSQVAFGTSQSSLSNIATGNYTSYTAGSYKSGAIHHVKLTGLATDTVYYYQCGDVTNKQTSGILSFRTMPSVGSTKSFSVGIIGDLGNTVDSQTTVEHILSNNGLSMVLHAGDLSYANCNQPLWDSYGVMVSTLASKLAWMAGPGNHEIEVSSTGMFQAFEARYRMPAVKPAEYGDVTVPSDYCTPSVFQMEYNYGNSFFSFDMGSVHVIFLNPYTTSDPSSAQYNWLLSDLKAVDRSVTPWVISVMHCPWYNSNEAHYGEWQTVTMRQYMEPVLYENHVNMVFAGHVHAYEATYPVFQNTTKDDGIVYVTIGDAGNAEGHASTYYEQPSWSAFRNGTQYGHGILTFVDSQRMVWEWHRNVDGEFVVIDSRTICNSAFGKVNC